MFILNGFKDAFDKLVKSRKFWLSMVAVVQTSVFIIWTDFDPALWQAIDVIIGLLIGGIALEDFGKAAAKV